MVFSIWNSDRQTQYEIVLAEKSGRLLVTCNCPAGRFGRLCRHRKMILVGDFTAVCDRELVSTIQGLMGRFDARTIVDMLSALSDSERRVVEAKDQLKVLTKRLEDVLIEGIPIRSS